MVSKTIDAPYALGNPGLWRKAKWLNHQEFVVVGWSNPGGTRPPLGALLLGYYTDDGKLVYAGRVGTGMPVRVVEAGPGREKDGVVRWRRIDLKRVIAESFGVNFHPRYVGKLLHGRYDNATCSASICPTRGVGAALALPYAPRRNLAQCRRGRLRRAASRQCRAASRANSMCRKTSPQLAVSAPELALKHCRRKLRCDPQRLRRRPATLITRLETITSIGLRDWVKSVSPYDPWY